MMEGGGGTVGQIEICCEVLTKWVKYLTLQLQYFDFFMCYLDFKCFDKIAAIYQDFKWLGFQI